MLHSYDRPFFKDLIGQLKIVYSKYDNIEKANLTQENIDELKGIIEKLDIAKDIIEFTAEDSFLAGDMTLLGAYINVIESLEETVEAICKGLGIDHFETK